MLVGLVVLELVVEVWVLVGVVVLVLVEVVVVVVLVELVLGVVVVRQSRWARTPTVLAPCRRFRRSRWFTVTGRFATD